MQDRWAIGGVSRDEPQSPEPRARVPLSARILVFVVGLVAVAAIGAAAWVYAETQRELRRVSSDIAQIKVSLELYGRQQAGGAPVVGSFDDAVLEDIEDRLAILEESWRGQEAAAPPSLPEAAGEADDDAASASAANGTLADCMPQDTRFLVTAGDSYPVCGSSGVVDVIGVGELEVSFKGGDAIAVGGSTALAGTTCIVSVLSANADGLAGYGELRVSC